MTKSETSSEILPVDRRGRVRVSAQRRQELLDQFEQSKLSGQKFAKLTGLKYSTFAAWVSKRRKERDAISPTLPGHAKGASVQWLETVITEAQNAAPIAGSALVVRLPSGAAIELANASQAAVAAALLRAWEKAPC
jgi:hypothetical protein